MTDKPSNEKVWSDFEPESFMDESEVPAHVIDLKELVDNWLTDNIEYMDPSNWGDIDKYPFRKKAFGEVSGYLLNAEGVSNEEPLPEIHDLIVSRVNGRYFPHLLARSPRELHHFATPFIYAGYMDELDRTAEKRLLNVVESGAYCAAERVPYRQIEYIFILKFLSRLFGCNAELYDEKQALENSILNNQPNIVRCMLPDAYCITHNIFFRNNYYGIFPEMFPDESTPYEITPLLRGLILRFMAEDNTDIVLELVCAGILERKISRQIVQLVLSWIFEKITDGYVPGPSTDKSDLMKSLDVVEDSLEANTNQSDCDYANEREAIWIENYHTTIVAGMTARIIARDWDKIKNHPIDPNLDDKPVRRDICRLGQMLQSLSCYNLQTGAKQMKTLSQSPGIARYETVCQHAIDFLSEQQTIEGEFGFWPKEKIIYTESGNPTEMFRSELQKPASNACREALTTFDSIVNESSTSPN